MFLSVMCNYSVFSSLKVYGILFLLSRIKKAWVYTVKPFIGYNPGILIRQACYGLNTGVFNKRMLN